MIIDGRPENVNLGLDYSDTEPPDEPIDVEWLVSMVMGLDTAFSIVEIESLLREPKKILNGVDQKTIDKLEDLGWERLLGYPVTCDTLRDDILDCAADDPQNIPWLQCLTLYHAVYFFHDFRTIGCYSEVRFAEFISAFANATWWSARWQELLREYGDQTLDFLI